VAACQTLRIILTDDILSAVSARDSPDSFLLCVSASLRELSVVFPAPIHHEEHEDSDLVLLSLFVSFAFFVVIPSDHPIFLSDLAF